MHFRSFFKFHTDIVILAGELGTPRSQRIATGVLVYRSFIDPQAVVRLRNEGTGYDRSALIAVEAGKSEQGACSGQVSS